MSESIVEWKPRPRDRVFIKLSGGRFFTVPQSETLPLKPGAVLSEQDIEQLSRIDQYFRGRDKALRLLAIRPRTRYEIRNALDGLNMMDSIRDGVLDELKERGLVDDRRFAREYVRSRVEVKGLGPHRLKFELERRGVHPALVGEVLKTETSAVEQEEMARRVVTKKLAGRRPDEKDVAKLSALLQRKGIDYEIINRLTFELLGRARHENGFDE
ncbi:MAG: regulatory protein RecX [Candidatus Krumholzibacteriia bacterium]